MTRRILLYLALPFVALWCTLVWLFAKHEHPAIPPVEPDDRRAALELAINDVSQEIMSARGKWPAFNSAHEGYAVALEKVDELWEHVKCKQKNRDLDAMRREAIQAAAMFTAFAAECCGETTGRV
jgi:hypothetical protein